MKEEVNVLFININYKIKIHFFYSTVMKAATYDRGVLPPLLCYTLDY